MSVLSASQVLSLYTWLPLVVLLSIYLLIARFYNRSSGRRTYYWFYVAPIVLFGISAVRYASVDQLSRDLWGDLASVLGGAFLLGLTTYLFWQMMRGGQK